MKNFNKITLDSIKSATDAMNRYLIEENDPEFQLIALKAYHNSIIELLNQLKKYE